MQKVYFKPAEDFIEKANKVFQEQKITIKKLIPLADIQHIGSTAIPGSFTKGDLDIVVRVAAENFNNAIQKLKILYDINQPENWSETFASFKDENNLGIDFGAQLVIVGSKSDNFVKQRDMLVNNPKLIEKYNAMKTQHEGKDMAEYRKAKAEFFQKLIEKPE